VGIAAAVHPSTIVERKLIITVMVETPNMAASRDVDTTKKWIRDETMICGKTSLTRTPASVSTNASMTEWHMKTCAASSTMQLTAPQA